MPDEIGRWLPVKVKTRSFIHLRHVVNLLGFLDSSAGSLVSTSPYLVVAGRWPRRVKFECDTDEEVRNIVEQIEAHQDLSMSELRSAVTREV